MSHLSIPVGETDHVQGAADAPVTLVEYGDYECPYCGAAYPVVKAVQAAMGQTVRFVFRNFPLSQVHEHAMLAAEAAESAGAQSEQGFWQMHDWLYEHQDRLDLSNILAHAKFLGLDIGRMRREMEAGAHRSRIGNDFRGGVRSGVNGTPTFFINGQRFDGDFDEPGLSGAIRRASR